MWMVCGSNNPPDEGPTPPPGRLSAPPNQRTFGKCQINTFKNSSYSPFEIHICWKFTISQLKTCCGECPTQAQGPKHTKTASALGLKAIASQIEKQLAHHAHLTINLHCATHSENCAKNSSANLLRDSFKSPDTTTDSLRDFFRWSPSMVQESSALLTQSSCWHFTPAASRRHVPYEHLTL